jgi:hypothetical protein
MVSDPESPGPKTEICEAVKPEPCEAPTPPPYEEAQTSDEQVGSEDQVGSEEEAPLSDDTPTARGSRLFFAAALAASSRDADTTHHPEGLAHADLLRSYAPAHDARSERWLRNLGLIAGLAVAALPVSLAVLHLRGADAAPLRSLSAERVAQAAAAPDRLPSSVLREVAPIARSVALSPAATRAAQLPVSRGSEPADVQMHASAPASQARSQLAAQAGIGDALKALRARAPSSSDRLDEEAAEAPHEVLITMDALGAARTADVVRVQVNRMVFETSAARWPLELVVYQGSADATEGLSVRAWALRDGAVVGSALEALSGAAGESLQMQVQLDPRVVAGQPPKARVSLVESLAAPTSAHEGTDPGDAEEMKTNSVPENATKPISRLEKTSGVTTADGPVPPNPY